MPTYRVSAVTAENEPYREAVTADDRFAVYREIRERGHTLVSIEAEGRRSFLSIATLGGFFQNISDDEKVLVARNLSAMLEAGLTTSRALAVLEKQSKNKRLKEVLQSLVSSIGKGNSLSASFDDFRGVFSPLLISMVKAGEESGKLAESLKVVAHQMEQANNLKKKIRGALMYPSIVLIAMLAIGVLMLIYVVPTLTQTFAELGTELPPTTRAVILVSGTLSAYPILSLLMLVLLLFGGALFLRTALGRKFIDFVALKLPVVRGLVQETNSARTARTLASLLSAGVDMVLAISITREVIQNEYYAKVLAEAEEVVTKGGTLSATFSEHSKLYPALVAEMTAVGEETGRLSGLLQETASFYEESVERQTKDLSTIIEPFLMLVIGAAVGFFAISMIAPIYSLSNAI